MLNFFLRSPGPLSYNPDKSVLFALEGGKFRMGIVKGVNGCGTVTPLYACNSEIDVRGYRLRLDRRCEEEGTVMTLFYRFASNFRGSAESEIRGRINYLERSFGRV